MLIARRWCSWPCSIDSPCDERDAQAGAVERLLDVVGRQGIAGEERPGSSPRGSTGRRGRPSRCARSPARRPAAPSCPSARVARIASTTPCTLTDLGFSLETVEFMNPNGLDLARPLDRQHAHPRVADHDRHARPRRGSSACTAPCRRPRSTTIPQSISWSSTSIQRPLTRTCVGWLVVL